MNETKTEDRCICVTFNTKLNRFLVYDKNVPHNFAIGVTIEQAINKLKIAA